jgi:SAM-dependent methyltransferase
MHGLSAIDGGRRIDWGSTSRDYADWRPDYPRDFYERLAALGVGRPGQRILDLGTGVGFLARNCAARGAEVTGIDISAGQITEAHRQACAAGLGIVYLVRGAEETGFPNGSFDVVTASQCWLYFDRPRAIAEVKRLLRPTGVLVTSHFCWLPHQDPIAAASEALVLKHNPDWTASGWTGVIPPIPSWAVDDFDLVGMFVFDVPIAFTRESWRGRMRACRGIGSLTQEEVARFDAEHAQLLAESTPDSFTILHRIDAHILRPKTK